MAEEKTITPRSGPVAASITLKDRITNDASITREHIVSVSYSPATVSPPVTKLFLSETQSAAPSGTDTRFINLPASPLFTLQNHAFPEGGPRTIWVWTSDGTTVQNTGPSSYTITLGAHPFVLSLTLTDRTTGNSISTNSRTISAYPQAISPNRPLGGTNLQYFLSETQTTPPAWNSTFFFTSFPHSFTLSAGTGLKTLYLWARDNYFVSNASTQGHITITAPPVSPVKTFTYVLKKGQNLISPALTLSPRPMRAAHFFKNNADAMLYLDSNNDPAGIFATDFIGLSPGDAAWENDTTNIRLKGSLGYEVITAGLATGQIRTIAFTGTSL